jgi:UDP-glucuronate 4-epimerase
MRVLVTGGAGFIGSHVAAKLQTEGHVVVCVDNFSDYYPIELKKMRVEEILKPVGVPIEDVDLADMVQVEKLFAKFDPQIVVHLAAQAGVRLIGQEMIKYVSSNLSAFGNVLLIATSRNVEAFLYASSSSVYGDHAQVPFKESEKVLVPTSFYGASKLANEVLAKSLSGRCSTRIRGLRFFTVYGPYGRPDMAYFRIATSLVTNSEFKLFGDGEIKRDFTFIDDVVKGVTLLISQLLTEKPGFTDVVNLGGGRPVSMLDLIEGMERISADKLKYSFQSRNSSDVSITCSDSSYLESLTGYVPAVTVDEGMTEVVNWTKRPDIQGKLADWIAATP